VAAPALVGVALTPLVPVFTRQSGRPMSASGAILRSAVAALTYEAPDKRHWGRPGRLRHSSGRGLRRPVGVALPGPMKLLLLF
jgi:hypothetical protein